MQAYFSLFFFSLLAATFLPGGSEILLLAQASEGYNLVYLWLAATAGNTLGSIINYGLGRYLLHYQDHRWFPISSNALEKGQHWFQHYGRWSLLFAWLPLVGDPLTFVAGLMRVPFIWFVLLVGLGKALRYGVLLGGLNWLL